jgi:CheY-like chemotaxis protein/two-component sensor histidine kinase
MLAFARRQELRPEAVHVGKLVDSMTEMLQRSLGPTIRITTDISADLAPTRVDPNQLELALLNLAVNARDAMPAGGVLNLSARIEQIAAGRVPGLGLGDYVCIGVTDNGCGMDEATLDRATEPFFTTKGPGRGTGLGLSMVDGLVAQSGGAMRVTSRPQRGTSVELWLPVASEGERGALALPAASSSVGEPRHFRVLVVDDDPIVAAGTAAMIEDLGHSAIEALSAAAALDVLRSTPEVDLVVTDYAMPGMTGIEMAAAIRRDRPDLPVVIATGYADVPTEEVKLPRLSKPYRQQELATLMEVLIVRTP